MSLEAVSKLSDCYEQGKQKKKATEVRRTRLISMRSLHGKNKAGTR